MLLNDASILIPELETSINDHVFAQIAMGLRENGYAVIDKGIPEPLAAELYQTFFALDEAAFKEAKIGRSDLEQKNQGIRSDKISWIEGDRPATKAWLAWANDLQVYLNRNLLLGLFSFESHMAIYTPGAFYKRHMDAFKGQANRILTVVAYFNKDWSADNGGELVLYQDEQDLEGIKISPDYRKLVVFLSEEFPHEVLPANKNRYSIAAWYRLNESTLGAVNPPR